MKIVFMLIPFYVKLLGCRKTCRIFQIKLYCINTSHNYLCTLCEVIGKEYNNLYYMVSYSQSWIYGVFYLRHIWKLSLVLH